MIKQFFNQDKISVGVIAILASEVLCALLLALALVIAHQPIAEHIRWFVAAFVPALLVMRHYMKQKEHLLTTKSAIVTMFVTFVAFMFYLIKCHII